jgi:hypothetical protein
MSSGEGGDRARVEAGGGTIVLVRGGRTPGHARTIIVSPVTIIVTISSIARGTRITGIRGIAWVGGVVSSIDTSATH